MNHKILLSLFALVILFSCQKTNTVSTERAFNAAYEGENLNRLAFPIGGIGAGMSLEPKDHPGDGHTK